MRSCVRDPAAPATLMMQRRLRGESAMNFPRTRCEIEAKWYTNRTLGNVPCNTRSDVAVTRFEGGVEIWRMEGEVRSPIAVS